MIQTVQFFTLLVMFKLGSNSYNSNTNLSSSVLYVKLNTCRSLSKLISYTVIQYRLLLCFTSCVHLCSCVSKVLNLLYLKTLIKILITTRTKRPNSYFNYDYDNYYYNYSYSCFLPY